MAELEAYTQVCDFAPRPRPANLSCPTANLIKTLLAFDKIECGVTERARGLIRATIRGSIAAAIAIRSSAEDEQADKDAGGMFYQ